MKQNIGAVVTIAMAFILAHAGYTSEFGEMVGPPTGRARQLSDANFASHFIASVSNDTLAVRAGKYLRILENVGLGPSRLRPVEGFESLVHEMVRRDPDGLVELERSVESMDTKRALWVETAGATGDVSRSIMRMWAIDHPKEIQLMRHHPNGEALLMDAIENNGLFGHQRAMAAMSLADIGGTNVLPRLDRLKDDQTLIRAVSGYYPRTLGAFASDVMRTIQARSAATSNGVPDSVKTRPEGPSLVRPSP